MLAIPVCPVESLYVHVPFCARKCTYCAFYSEASDGAVIERYVNALRRDMQRVAPWMTPRTIFFGGGTPSLLNLRQWRVIFETMDRLGWLGASEWTVECNPATVSLEKARLWREHGVNRISMGVQSLDEALLDRLGRVHSREMVFKSYDILRQGGFENVNLDLMFAIPGQTLGVWQSTLREALDLEPDHLSCYEVIYEEDTPLFAQLRAGEFSVEEDLACGMYEALLAAAAGRGLWQYEIANFARGPWVEWEGGVKVPVRACRHNVNYWQGGQYEGLGPSAAGYRRGARTRNVAHTPGYCAALEEGRSPVASSEVLSPLARAGEVAAFGLRMISGWGFEAFRERTGLDLREHWESAMAELVSCRWAVRTADRFYLTELGLRFADAAAERFLLLDESRQPAGVAGAPA